MFPAFYISGLVVYAPAVFIWKIFGAGKGFQINPVICIGDKRKIQVRFIVQTDRAYAAQTSAFEPSGRS